MISNRPLLAVRHLEEVHVVDADKLAVSQVFR